MTDETMDDLHGCLLLTFGDAAHTIRMDQSLSKDADALRELDDFWSFGKSPFYRDRGEGCLKKGLRECRAVIFSWPKLLECGK